MERGQEQEQEHIFQFKILSRTETTNNCETGQRYEISISDYTLLHQRHDSVLLKLNDSNTLDSFINSILVQCAKYFNTEYAPYANNIIRFNTQCVPQLCVTDQPIVMEFNHFTLMLYNNILHIYPEYTINTHGSAVPYAQVPTKYESDYLKRLDGQISIVFDT